MVSNLSNLAISMDGYGWKHVKLPGVLVKSVCPWKSWRIKNDPNTAPGGNKAASAPTEPQAPGAPWHHGTNGTMAHSQQLGHPTYQAGSHFLPNLVALAPKLTWNQEEPVVIQGLKFLKSQVITVPSPQTEMFAMVLRTSSGQLCELRQFPLCTNCGAAKRWSLENQDPWKSPVINFIQLPQGH